MVIARKWSSVRATAYVSGCAGMLNKLYIDGSCPR